MQEKATCTLGPIESEVPWFSMQACCLQDKGIVNPSSILTDISEDIKMKH